MTAPSRMFYERTKRASVYNIQAIANIPSVISNGLLSYDRAAGMAHEPIAMPDVQNRRDNIRIPNGGLLHSYASAYFNPRNPMMYRRQNMAQSLCILAISAEVLDFPGTIVSDGNAASDYSRFYIPEEGIRELNFAEIYSGWWTDDDRHEQSRKKRLKCAEVLVPGIIPYEYIIGAVVLNEQAEHELEVAGFHKRIIVRPRDFFQKEG